MVNALRDCIASSTSHRIRIINVRTTCGSYLVELLVALAVSGFLAAVMGASLSETMQTSSGAQNQLMAADIAQELIDRVRNTAFGNLPPNGTYLAHTDSDDGVIVGPYSFQQEPTLMDVANLTWTNRTLNNRFRGTANVVLADGPTSDTRRVTVTIAWREQSATRTYSQSTIIASSGVHIR